MYALCISHVCQVVLRWVRKNVLKKAYDKGERGRYKPSQVPLWVRRLQYLAFLPADHVPSAFNSLSGDIPSELGLGDFLSYFSSTRVQGFLAGRSVRFLPESWSSFDRTSGHLNRTNNYLETWNRQFTVQVGHVHLTIWNFMAAVYIWNSP